MLARLDPAAGAAQELAVGELGAGALEGAGGLGVRVEGRQEEALGFALVLREECAAVQDDRTCPGGPAALRPRLEDVQPRARGRPFACADRSFDPIERTPEDDQRRGDLSTAPESLLCPTESQLQQRERPVRDLGDDPEPASRGELPTLGRERPALVFGSAERRESASRTSCCATRSCWPISRASWRPSFALAAAEGQRPAQNSAVARRGRICVTMLSAPLARARAAASRWVRYAALIVAEVEGGPSREQQRHRLLAGRIVIELLRELERFAEPRSGIGEVALGMGSEPDEELREHAGERGFLDDQTAGHFGDRDTRLAVARISSGDAGEVEQLEGALAVDRRDLLGRPQEQLAGIGRRAASHLDKPRKRSMSARWIGSETSGRALSSSIRARSARPPSQAFSAAAVNRRARCSSSGVSAAARSKASEAAAKALRSLRPLGRLLELLDDRRVGLDRSRRAVPGAPIGVDFAVEHVRERTMRGLSLRKRRRLIDGGTNERVAKLEPVPRYVHQPGLLGAVERVGSRAQLRGRTQHGRELAAVVCGGDEQKRLRLLRQPMDASKEGVARRGR